MAGAANALSEGEVDLLLCDAGDDNVRLGHLVGMLLDKGFSVPIIAVIGEGVTNPSAPAQQPVEDDDANRPAAGDDAVPAWRAAGATAAFCRHWNQGRLLEAMRLALESHRAASGEGPLHSTVAFEVAQCPAAVAMLAAYVQEARRLGEALRDFAAQPEPPVERMQDIYHALANTAARFGFATLNEAADDVLKVLGGVTDTTPALRKVELLCGALRPGVPETKDADGHGTQSRAA